MNFAKIFCVMILTSAAFGADQPKNEPRKPDAPAATANEPQENSEWLQAIERLRSLPRPGEVKNGIIRSQTCDIYVLTDEQKKKYAEIQAAYDAELLKRAAKWEEEEKTVRAEFEAKLIPLLPEEKREPAKKLLDFSHSKWITPLEREEKFKKEYAERVYKLQQARATMSVEELNEERDKMRAWVKQTRAKIGQNEDETMSAVKAMLTPEEAARLKTSKE